MARDLTASVGRLGGKNIPSDVETVQELLNRVPEASGGPAPFLDVDGKCGPKTIAAIQKFQLKHFGWSGADGRVDPNGPTHNRLNAFDTPIPVLPPVPPQPQTLPASNRFVIHRMGTATSFNTQDIELFFHITDMTNGLIGIYWFQPSGRAMTTQQPREKFVGPSRSFTTKAPHAVDKLACDAMYASHERAGQGVTSRMVLFLTSGPVQIEDMPHHLIGPNGIIMPSKGDTDTAIGGNLRFVKTV